MYEIWRDDTLVTSFDNYDAAERCLKHCIAWDREQKHTWSLKSNAKG